MIGYVARRLAESLIVLLLVSFACYFLIGLMPGDPIDLMFSADPEVTSEDLERLKARYGLDQPLLDRYLSWLGNALRGELGFSRLYNQPVGELVWPRLWATLQLLGVATILSIAIAVPLGVWAAARQHGIADYSINFLCFAGISIPPFWLSLMLILLVAVPISWIPSGGMGEPDAGLWETLRHMLLPVFALTIASVGGFTRFMRAAMLQTLAEDYMRTAKAKGAGLARRLFGHALRNALLPLVTILALSLGSLFSGALITETIFSWLGMGRTIYDAVMGNDFNLALIGLMLATAFTLTANILADVLYAVLDPRIKLDRRT